jgi:four helix bundle protein
MDFNYEKLDVAKLAKRLILDVYNISKEFPAEERFGMISQLRRAAVSILLNIAEGNSRATKKDYRNFVRIAIGSAVETDCVLKIAIDLNYIHISQYKIVEPIIRELYFKLIGLSNYLKES